MSMAMAIPADGDQAKWTDREKALVEAAGLVSRGNLAPRPVVEAFLSHCHRTGLDPIARQIYCIERGGKWTTQISIDGARLVAERSREYEGQTPTQWTADGVTWLDVWLDESKPPAAARVGVYRRSFREPLFAVATFKAYSAGGNMWSKMPALMLGKCAEMLALRKAFPQDLSGLYSAEEMDQATPAARPEQAAPRASAPAPASAPEPALEPAEVRQLSKDWLALANAARTRDELRPVYAEAQAAGDLDVMIADGRALGEYLWELRDRLPEKAEDVVDAEVVDETVGEPVHDWPTAEVPA
ncbi:phage recombination protein Bet [Microbacterium testaceum]|uniref:phage recombination protein Bet n=1 Tax=Microbacterium testaceum TaxID=2033 RepID=UPI002780D68B|nr:phage recombination protein Bet [Microbacterium testaceum]MDQ1174205.1 phage recombination protein Bet [Microbacterium testaceum]